MDRTHRIRRSHDMAGARGLGWASIAIGLAELLATRQVQRLLGVRPTRQQAGILRTLGVRELMHGISLLGARPRSAELAAGVWSRVAGDVLDNVLLASAVKKTRNPTSLAAVAGAVAVIGLLDCIYARRLTQDASRN